MSVVQNAWTVDINILILTRKDFGSALISPKLSLPSHCSWLTVAANVLFKSYQSKYKYKISIHYMLKHVLENILKYLFSFPVSIHKMTRHTGYDTQNYLGIWLAGVWQLKRITLIPGGINIYLLNTSTNISTYYIVKPKYKSKPLSQRTHKSNPDPKRRKKGAKDLGLTLISDVTSRSNAM